MAPNTYSVWVFPPNNFVTTRDVPAGKNPFLRGMRTKHIASPEAQATKQKSRFRLELKRHNHRVVITDCVDRGRYISYVVSYYLDGCRKQVRRASLDEAKLEANLVLAKLAQGEPDVLALTSTDRLIHLRACEALAEINVPLDVAISEYVHAQSILKGMHTLTDAAHHYVKQYAGFQSTMLVQQAVDELLNARRADGSSPVHVADLECRLGVFAKAFSCPLCEVLDNDVCDFLLSLKFEARTKNNYRTAISNLFTFARLKKFVLQGYAPLKCVPEFKEPHRPVDILTVDGLILQDSVQSFGK